MTDEMIHEPTAPSSADGPATNRHHRKWPWILFGVIVLLIIAAWFAVNMYADHWIATHGKDTAVLPSTAPWPGAHTVVYNGSLHAWYVAPSSSGKPTVIIVHGYGANRTDHEQVGSALRAAGFGVMSVDLGYETGSTNYGGGTREATDVESAVAYAHAHGSSKVVLLGYSAGGTDAVLAANNGGVTAVVADSSPYSFIHLASDKVSVPSWIFAPAAWFYPMFSSGGSLGSLSSIPANYHVPTLVIQGTADKTVDPSNGQSVATATHGALWLVPGVGHTKTYETCSAAYVSQLIVFYSDALTGKHFVVKPTC